MQKGEQIDPFLGRLKEIRDQMISIGATPDQELIPEHSLRRLGGVCLEHTRRATLLDWKEMWASLCQEEIKTLSKVGSSGKGIIIKKEKEVDAALASEGKQEKWKKEDLSNVKCFHCGELGHYATQCLRKKSKGEDSKTKAVAEKEVETDDDCAMSARAT